MSTDIKYSTLSGFFAQDDPAADAVAIGALPARFGLLDDSSDRWEKFKSRIHELNSAAPNGTKYKVVFFARHGEGVHNVAETKYGIKAWDDYWSKLNGDGELVWGPDPDLTAKGVGQAVAAREAWKTELAHGIPLPQKHYASPLQRALQTFDVTFAQAGIADGKNLHTTIIENLREQYGEHTCDMRSSRTVIAQNFRPPAYDFEDDFEEADLIWKADEREAREHVRERALLVLNRIFAKDEESFFCLTAHNGIINGFLAALGRPQYPLPTGGILPLVIKAVVQ